MSLERTLAGIRRGFAGRCPNCGEDKLFRKYLKVEPICQTCGHDNAQYPADDGPAYFTILIVGHLIIAPAVVLPFLSGFSPWAVLGVTLPLLALFTLWLLSKVKGAVIGLQWAIREGEGRPPGQEPDPV